MNEVMTGSRYDGLLMLLVQYESRCVCVYGGHYGRANVRLCHGAAVCEAPPLASTDHSQCSPRSGPLCKPAAGRPVPTNRESVFQNIFLSVNVLLPNKYSEMTLTMVCLLHTFP